MKRYKFGWDFLYPEFKRFVYTYEPAGTVQPEAVAAVNTTVNTTS